MTKITHASIVLCGALGLLLGANAMAADVAAGKAKAEQLCTSCHGADGNSVNPEWPKLAGQHAGYLAKQLADFKAGEARQNAIMAGMVAGLSEDDMANLGAYFAEQTGSGGFASAERVALGEQIYRGGNLANGVPACTACHGPRGGGDALAGFPSLSGQHAQYTAAQLRAFRQGHRANDVNQMMRNAARWLSDEEIEAVAEYIAGLH